MYSRGCRKSDTKGSSPAEVLFTMLRVGVKGTLRKKKEMKEERKRRRRRRNEEKGEKEKKEVGEEWKKWKQCDRDGEREPEKYTV